MKYFLAFILISSSFFAFADQDKTPSETEAASASGRLLKKKRERSQSGPLIKPAAQQEEIKPAPPDEDHKKENEKVE